MSVKTGLIATGLALCFVSLSATAAAAQQRDQYDRDGRYWNRFRHQGAYTTGFMGSAFGGEVDFGDGVELDLDAGFLIGATLGYDNLFPGPSGDLRVEGEISYRSQDFDGSPDGVSSTAFLLNGWYDFDTNTPFVPYAGLGMGFSFVNDSVFDDTSFAFQLGAGLVYHFDHRLMFGFNYRYLFSDWGSKLDYAAHQASLSVGYKF